MQDSAGDPSFPVHGFGATAEAQIRAQAKSRGSNSPFGA
jgi:hypothetical protein